MIHVYSLFAWQKMFHINLSFPCCNLLVSFHCYEFAALVSLHVKIRSPLQLRMVIFDFFIQNVKKCVTASCFISDCQIGYYWENCIYACPYPYYGHYCLQKCTCTTERCNFMYGCNSGKCILFNAFTHMNMYI